MFHNKLSPNLRNLSFVEVKLSQVLTKVLDGCNSTSRIYICGQMYLGDLPVWIVKNAFFGGIMIIEKICSTTSMYNLNSLSA